MTKPWKKQQQEKRKAKEQAKAAQKAEQQPVVAAKQPVPEQHPWPAARESYNGKGDYRFVNPYNFVRYLPAPTTATDNPDTQLLGRCPPPPHDRYVGLSGRIICLLETVTPLFIADSEAIELRGEEHKSYRFFQFEGRDAIPATSLRGMIRSLFEAVTNAPFTVFNGEERLEYRLDPAEARKFKAGIVRALSTEGKPGAIALCEEAKIGAYYDNPAQNLLDDTWRCGEEAYAIIGKTKNNVPKVEILARSRGAFDANDLAVKQGWVKVTGKTIETKRNESFFYFADSTKPVTLVNFDEHREADYNKILHAQLTERSADFHSQVQHARLTPGDLVYVELEQDAPDQVRNIALARVARLRYRQPIDAHLPTHLKPCTSIEELDIASRLFGWVFGAHQPTSEPLDRSKTIAYAGRLRFSHANLTEDGDKGVYQAELPLAILGAPKPTTTLFYLTKSNGEWTLQERTTITPAETIGFDGANQLRGRKFYRHHGNALNRQEYERADRQQDNQNRSVRGVRVPGNRFSFTIDFNNLAPLELGALLWVLQLGDEGCYCRLGYAKPLGFGSVKLEPDTVQLLDFSTRYRELNHVGAWRRATTQERSNWLYRFEQAMKKCYGRSIRDLENLRDLFALLRDPGSQLPRQIHYPRSTPKPDPAGKNFEWFVGNKRKNKNPQSAGPNLPLEIAATDSVGLPLIQKDGKSGH
jgi:CRISPR-associated protein (TIGR03986 family)